MTSSWFFLSTFLTIVAYLVKTFPSLLKLSFLLPASKATAADVCISNTNSSQQLKSAFQGPVQYCRYMCAQICQLVSLSLSLSLFFRFLFEDVL